jgi:DNA-binding response OmpR family regulator
VTTPPRTLLLIGAEPALAARALSALEAAGLEVKRPSHLDEALRAVSRTIFDVVVVRHPLPGLSLEQFVQRLRAVDSACRDTSLLVLCDPEAAAVVGALLGRGVNRIVSATASGDRLLDAVVDLLAAPAGPTRRKVAQLEVRLQFGSAWLRTVTHNVSRTGLLVEGGPVIPLGTHVPFELRLPGQHETVSGTLEVVRRTNPRKESTEGFGARILAFEPGSESRLRAFLDAGEPVRA